MKQRIAFFAGGALVLVALWFFLIYVPVARERSRIDSEIQHTRDQIADFNSTIESLPQFLKRYHDLEAFKEQLNSSLYAKGDILKLLEEITQDAVQNNLKIVEISPPVSELLELNRQSEMTDDPQFLNIRLDLEGNFVDFGKYVSHLEATAYFRKINFCSVRGQQEVQPELDLSIGFRALIGMAKGVS